MAAGSKPIGSEYRLKGRLNDPSDASLAPWGRFARSEYTIQLLRLDSVDDSVRSHADHGSACDSDVHDTAGSIAGGVSLPATGTGHADSAFASNLIGIAVGGVVEYAALATGYRALLLAVMAFYAAALFFGRRLERAGAS